MRTATGVSQRWAAMACILMGVAGGALAAPPETVCVQGTLADASGQALTGARVWRVQFHDASTSGTALGLPLTGTTTVAASGRFSIVLTPPVEVIAAAGEVWYELAVDSAATSDDTIDQEDVFPVRVQVHSVLFAQRAARADRATTASNALAVAGVAAGDLATDAELTSGLSAKADAAHNHDSLYAAILHNHNGVYALIGHSHDLQDLGGAVTDAQVPDNITIDHATSASTASQADTATTATHASTAGQASTAGHSTTAGHSSTAGHSDTADTATTASAAGHSSTAGHSDTATTATTAGHSDTATTATASDRATTATYSSRAERVKQTVRDFVVASGKSVTAGDVVAFLNGEVEPFDAAGAESVFNSATTYHCFATALSSGKFVVAYCDDGNSRYGTAIVGDISGATLSWGSEYVFNSAITYYCSAAALSSGKFVVAYRDNGNSNYGTAIVGEVSGSAITYGSEFVFNSAGAYDCSAAALSSGKFVVAYRDDGNSGYGTAAAFDLGGEGSSLLGIAGADATAGQSVPVILDGVSDVHTGLTPWATYYATDGGALTTDDGGPWARPKVGRALSSTELLLKID